MPRTCRVRPWPFSRWRKFMIKLMRKLERPLLHAQTLGFIHPTKGEMNFSVPPPDDFMGVLEWLQFPFDNLSL